ncbi:hypothetical protein [Ligilactobacillus salivarius]|uniref:hypothetical protein n=1 Tax=Ligilactobacillus salivarius TaxID=1624 RepID=UPI0023686C95|nr:hypothetical protein [Ligilactobacillus salivarius]
MKSYFQTIAITITGFITIAIIVGAILGITHKNNDNSYKTIDTPINLSISQLNKHQGQAYLVLRRTGCRHCEEMESTIVPKVKQLRKKGKTVYVLDLAKMDKKQLAYIAKSFPVLLVDQNRIKTPTVAKIESLGNRWLVVKFDNTNSKANISEVLK